MIHLILMEPLYFIRRLSLNINPSLRAPTVVCMVSVALSTQGLRGPSHIYALHTTVGALKQHRPLLLVCVDLYTLPTGHYPNLQAHYVKLAQTTPHIFAQQ